jgi:hypothetical protein
VAIAASDADKTIIGLGRIQLLDLLSQRGLPSAGRGGEQSVGNLPGATGLNIQQICLEIISQEKSG